MIVVIPSCREIDLTHLAPLIDSGARFIVVDDTEGTIRVNHPQFTVLNWADRRRILGGMDYAIPRRNGASRSLGFLMAWWESDDDEIIVALDDDCVVEDADFAATVERILGKGVTQEAVGTREFINILDLYEGLDTARVFPRGFPYSHRIRYTPAEFDPCPPRPVVFNLGLWSGILDINAVDKIRLDSWSIEHPALRVANAILPPGSLGCLCSMNMHFRRSIIPAVYQLPMHVEVMPDLVIDRYGDIWGGFILQLLAARRQEVVSVGGPMIRHLKEGGFERNLWQEHAAHLVNDEFVGVLRSCAEQIKPGSYLEMMRELAVLFAEETPRRSPILREYLSHLTPAVTAWVKLLSQGSSLQ
jgi:hypothetical protein